MLRKKIRSAVTFGIYLVSMLCFACAVCVLMVCCGDSGGSFQHHHVGLDASEKGGLVIAYVLASIGVTLWIFLGRMDKAEYQASRDETDDARRASST